MKKYLIAIAFLFGASTVRAGSGSLIAGHDADFSIAVLAASGTVAIGAGAIDAICVTTGTAAGYVVAYDTIPGNSLAYSSLLASTASLATVVFSTISVAFASGGSQNAGGNCWQAPFVSHGVRFNNALFIYNSLGGQSGDANKAYVYWRRD